MANVVCELPWPPSANHAWRPTRAGGKILTDAYVLFKKQVGDYVLEHRIRRYWTKQPLAVAILCRPPDRRAVDIDNRVKTLLDALASAGVIENDKDVDLIVIARGPLDPPKGSVFVRIAERSSLTFGPDIGDVHWPGAFDTSTNGANGPIVERAPWLKDGVL